tara:strand:+ start:216 stop:326 length:111 start_codon:yes stop_codon:yes gene_type:complete
MVRFGFFKSIIAIVIWAVLIVGFQALGVGIVRLILK